MMMQDHNQKPSPLRLNAEHAVLNALAGSDDERLWRLVRSTPDEDQALRVVAEEAPRLMHRRHHGSLFSELFLVPVIERSIGEVVGNRLNWRNAEICISESLRAWLGARVDQIVFRGVTPYEVVSADVKLTHCAGVKVTHLGDDGGLLAVDVDPGASSGDTCDGPQGRGDQGDREAAWLLAQHRAAVLA